jgi:hypothetical protein
LIAAAQQITQFGRGLKNAAQAGGQIRHPGRAREGDLTSIKVDGPGRISVHFENARRALSSQALQHGGNLRPGQNI